MKKLVFAMIAAVAMVSVSNVFAANQVVNNTTTEPTDSVAPADTVAPAADSVASVAPATIAE